jgi:hypothetical protein
MELQYRDGSTDNDRLFDESDEHQREYVARAMNLDPRKPESWPIQLIETLLSVRRFDGRQSFYRELGRLLSGDR